MAEPAAEGAERAALRRRALVVASAVVVALLVAGGWWIAATGAMQQAGAPPDASSSATATATATEAAPSGSAAPSTTPGAATPSPAATTAAPPGTDAPIAPELDPVAVDEPTEVADVRVTLADAERVQGVARLPGEISGPAVRLTVRIDNDGGAPLDAEYVVVSAFYGAARTPANELGEPGGAPFSGTIPPGGSAEGVYVFEASDAELADVLVRVETAAGEPAATFRGDLR
ncbi:hypothetical protein [Agrococcus terreus]|uniref:DUF4352 domain-containing protein n=1 Tax=Agrococcus terreus TaxID=574649 RepID=A0ABQ2KI43_9MICO|nr:hypothetical protein [Agrococcus terreus]GGN82031.1 hypothetical protein GCM10010968_11390 [Agrococcus terreus]